MEKNGEREPMEKPISSDVSAPRPGVRSYFDEHAQPGSRYITKYTNFFDIYDRYLESMRDRPIRMIEIGVQHGGSLQMWKRYLHPDSLIQHAKNTRKRAFKFSSATSPTPHSWPV